VSDRPTKVLYVAGVPHSGTTIISQVLGQLEGVVSIGELYYLWDALEQGLPCGCGKPVSECDFWDRVLSSALGEGSAGHGALRPDRYYMAVRELPAVMLRNASVPPPAYRRALAAVVRSTSAAADARVVVDSSKSPTFGRILDATEGIDLRVLHVVRSPPASGHSRSRVNPRYSPARHALLWSSWNAAIELMWSGRAGRYLRVRYEDFADHPHETIEEIARLIGERPSASPFIDDRRVRIEATHTVAGNNVRFQTGEIEIRRDDAWQRESPVQDRRTVDALTWPLRTRYGYRAGRAPAG
jgi:Sulfotransferase family